MQELRNGVEPWRVTLVDTGEGTMTGGRLKRVADQLDGETFCMTYGDGVSNIDIGALIDFHRESGAQATLSAVHQTGRFGALRARKSVVEGKRGPVRVDLGGRRVLKKK